MRFAAIALSVLAVSCAATPPEMPRAAANAPAPEPLSLPGTGWVVPGAANPNAAARLEFSATGRVTGFTGCNMLSGSYTYDGDRLEVVAATTKRACFGAGNELEAKLLGILSGRPRAAIVGNKLILTTPDGKAIELEKS